MPTRTPPPITVFGRTTCEDTAVVRDRLARLEVPFTEVDVDADPDAARLVESLSGGNRVTPTLLFGGVEHAMAEPSLDALDRRLAADGWPIHRPEPEAFHGDLIAHPLPMLTVVEPGGAAFRLTQLRGRRQVAIFFAHATGCLACAGYARQLAAVRPKLADADAVALVVVPGGPEDAARWRAEYTDAVTIVADHGGRWRQAVATHTLLDGRGAGDGAMLLALDRWLAPRSGSAAADAGGLVTPFQAAEWLEFLSFECAECATPLEWGDGT